MHFADDFVMCLQQGRTRAARARSNERRVKFGIAALAQLLVGRVRQLTSAQRWNTRRVGTETDGVCAMHSRLVQSFARLVALRVHRCSASGAEFSERSLSAAARTNRSLPIFESCGFWSVLTTKWFLVRRTLAHRVH